MRWPASICAVFFFLMTGCATTRTVTITTKPPNALLRIDGQPRGKGPITETFTFDDARRPKSIVANLSGYKTGLATVYSDYKSKTLEIVLLPETRHVNIVIEPVPAILTIDGKPVKTEAVSIWSGDLEFQQDAKGYWNQHTISADLKNWKGAQVTVPFYGEPDTTLTLTLEPLRKDLNFTTSPPGATISIDDQPMGTAPFTLQSIPFPVDYDTKGFIPKKVKVAKKGYDPVSLDISWDDGKSDYAIELIPKSKVVTITPEPPGSTVSISGHEIPQDANGLVSVPLKFQPNDKGEFPTYSGTVTPKNAAEYEPAKFTIAWENGKQDYNVPLKPIPTRKIALLKPNWLRGSNGWEVEPLSVETIARVDVGEDPNSPQPVKLIAAANIDTLAVSPDGSRVIYSVLQSSDKGDLRSQLFTIRTDLKSQPEAFSDGKSLDLAPLYTPAGDQIIYSSNRAGRRMSVWQVAASGSGGGSQLTTGENNDLFPSLDSDAKPRLYYESLIDNHAEPWLFSNVLSTMPRRVLTEHGGLQPRVSPRNDAIVFSGMDQKTNKRDLFLLPILPDGTPGALKNLTNTPDVDEFDPAWNADGSKIAFASDAGLDKDQNRNVDISVIDLNKAQRIDVITTNGSQDDCPAWDPSGQAIYFRSNRGNEWAIWKIAVGR